mmetsp:Transcript_39092/g.89842  ORF Transcript_39092/g.89842 Transcript_39092/m.89842 type:complete len:268 (+) Transcript_39092:239-1042(+)
MELGPRLPRRLQRSVLPASARIPLHQVERRRLVRLRCGRTLFARRAHQAAHAVPRPRLRGDRACACDAELPQLQLQSGCHWRLAVRPVPDALRRSAGSRDVALVRRHPEAAEDPALPEAHAPDGPLVEHQRDQGGGAHRLVHLARTLVWPRLHLARHPAPHPLRGHFVPVVVALGPAGAVRRPLVRLRRVLGADRHDEPEAPLGDRGAQLLLRHPSHAAADRRARLHHLRLPRRRACLLDHLRQHPDLCLANQQDQRPLLQPHVRGE